jgi:hypothetical protein
MAAQPPKADEPDPVEALRKRVGTDDKPKVKVGGVGPASVEERLKREGDRLSELAKAGSDPHGKEAIRKLMRRFRRA